MQSSTAAIHQSNTTAIFISSTTLLEFLRDALGQNAEPLPFLEAFGIYCIITAVLGVTLNTLAAIVWTAGRHSGTELRPELTCLAVTDLLSAVSLSLFDALILPSQLAAYENDLVCRLLGYFGHAIFYTSTLLNAVISLERFVVVYFPLRALNYTKPKKAAVICSAFVLGMLHEVQFLADTEMTCLLLTLGDGWIANLKLAISAIVIVTSYTLIAVKILCQKKIGEEIRISAYEKKIHDQKVQMIKVLGTDALRAIVTLFIATTILAFSRRLMLSGHLRVVLFSRALLLSNTFSSPVVYLIRSKTFRGDAAAIIKKIWRPCKRNRLKRGPKSLQSNISAVTAKEMERNGQSLTKMTELPSVYEADDLLEPPIGEGECNNNKTVSMTSAV